MTRAPTAQQIMMIFLLSFAGGRATAPGAGLPARAAPGRAPLALLVGRLRLVVGVLAWEPLLLDRIVRLPAPLLGEGRDCFRAVLKVRFSIIPEKVMRI